MEHRWGRNVSECGLSGIGATLAARILSAPNYVLTNARHPTLANNIQLWITRDDELPWTMSELGIGSLHFPYGLDVYVEPDEPL